MATIADLLSPSSKENLMSTIKRGDVVRMRLTEEEGITPKNEGDSSRNKYFIVLGKTADGQIIGFVVINTNINVNLSEVLKRLHYPLTAEKYPYLEKTRYVYCGALKQISLSNFSNRHCSIFGTIDEGDLQLITNALASSPIESKKKLRKFGLLVGNKKSRGE